LIFRETALAGSWVIDLEPIEDDRGFFARSFCRETFARYGLDPDCVQCNVSWNREAGTLRGMHYQLAPYEEAKLVRCTAGALHDVILDLRQRSPTFGQHVAVELSAKNRRMLYIPRGFAHGFQTLEDSTEVFYQMSTAYVPNSAAGLRHDDPALGIVWPRPVTRISARDLDYPPFDPARFGA
jgi:dTDP-4-dehydrorhamnose 3,5-epimerase